MVIGYARDGLLWSTCRATFARAYDWADVKKHFFTDKEDVSKTWISEIGLRLMPDTTIYAGVLGANEDQSFKCPSDVQACFKSGIVKVVYNFSSRENYQ